MDQIKSQIITVVNTVDKLNMQERLEAVSYLQKITEAYKSKSLCSDSPVNAESKNLIKNYKHKCRNHLCFTNNVKHLKKIVCFKCDKRLESEFQLFDHSQTHLDYPLSCLLCRCIFRNVEDYNSHKATDCNQNRGRYVCRVCHHSFPTKKTFQSHSLDNHGMKLYDNWYGCKLCQEMFEQKKLLYHHYKEAHSEMKCQFEKNGVKVANSKIDSQPKEKLVVNGNETSNDEDTEDMEKFQCVHCDRTFRKKSFLSVHIKRHLYAGDSEFVCKVCKKTFTVYRYYKRHLQSVSHQNKNGEDNPIFKCDICKKLFSSRDSLSRHQLRTHFTGDKRLKCPLCDFKTALATSLSRHVNLHTENRKFICDQCGSCFHTLSALKDHTVYVHSNERNYSCEICGQRFKLKSGLNRHFKTHSNEKEFKCFCGQVYKFRTNLRRHLLTAHKITGKKNNVTRVTTEEEGYALNSPKVVKQQKNKQTKDIVDTTNQLDEFDITSLSGLTDVDLLCADEVLCDTYNFSKSSNGSVESQESLNSILAPAQVVDHVLQQATEQKSSIMDPKHYDMLAQTSAANYVDNNLPPMNFRSFSCRQYLPQNFGDVLNAEYASQMASTSSKFDNQYLSASFEDTSGMMENACNRQYASNYLSVPEIPVDDENTFSYSKWLNEI
ncbi:zinc finger protein 93-like [Planococcus citri]|uniref:zinc finger protein 93-like n=1 Tax=Planococcus citri TaxID=170843 RepID=UPI0031F80D04